MNLLVANWMLFILVIAFYSCNCFLFFLFLLISSYFFLFLLISSYFFIPSSVLFISFVLFLSFHFFCFLFLPFFVFL